MFFFYILKPGSLLLTRMKPADFDYLKLIGKGSFGKVRIYNYFILLFAVVVFLKD